VLECVVNVSEGRRPDVVSSLASACGPSLLDVHADAHHNRSVFTLAGDDVEAAARALAQAAVGALDLGEHQGVHPRIGVLDVVPFVPLGSTELEEAIAARHRFAQWAGKELSLPCFLYGPERSLPEVRKTAFRSLAPASGPALPHPTAGACAVGARTVLVAYNVWLATDDLATARSIAAALRTPFLRLLGFDVGGRIQVSCNLTDPLILGPAEVYAAIREKAIAAGTDITGAELVGLIPSGVLEAIPADRWASLGLGREYTIEARMDAGPGPATPA
jgi:glutamate formiminotransferase / 5-formyltetrahydrofolate cyclo-ligase